MGLNGRSIEVKFKPTEMKEAVKVIGGILVDECGYRDPETEYHHNEQHGRDVHVHKSVDGSNEVRIDYQAGIMSFELVNPENGREQLGFTVSKVMSGLGKESLLVCPFSGVCGYEERQDPRVCRGNYLGCGVYRGIKSQTRSRLNGS